MYPDIQRCKTQHTWGHGSESAYIVNYYLSRKGPALIEPPPDYYFDTKLIGDTYTHRPTGEQAQIWFRDLDCHWKPAAAGEKHPYLSPSKASERYVLNIREDGFATWVQSKTWKDYGTRRTREVCI